MGAITGGARNIVTNGLVLHLDAANYKSYPGSGTTWTDLSPSNNNGKLTNGPTFSNAAAGSIILDGVNDTWSVSNITPGSSSFTIECFFKYKAHALYLPTILGSGDYWQGGFQIFWGFGQNGGQAAYNFQLRYNTDKHATYLTYPVDNTIYHFVGTRTISGSQQILKSYTNGILIETSAPSYIYDLSSQTTISTQQYVYTGPPPADIYSIKMYNRDLTAAEVLQNYNATRARFGV
jgi:hypothetical protein